INIPASAGQSDGAAVKKDTFHTCGSSAFVALRQRDLSVVAGRQRTARESLAESLAETGLCVAVSSAASNVLLAQRRDGSPSPVTPPT
ncbi:hypothetical protein PF002_g23004, partial [Phytophthora fragariae]